MARSVPWGLTMIDHVHMTTDERRESARARAPAVRVWPSAFGEARRFVWWTRERSCERRCFACGLHCGVDCTPDHIYTGTTCASGCARRTSQIDAQMLCGQCSAGLRARQALRAPDKRVFARFTWPTLDELAGIALSRPATRQKNWRQTVSVAEPTQQHM